MPKNFLKEIRTKKLLSQVQLAKKAGVSKQMIWGFENDKQGISTESLMKIANALNVSVNEILDGKSLGNNNEAKNKQLMTEAMNLALEYYQSDYEKVDVVKIAAELYFILLKEQSCSTPEEKDVLKIELENKYIYGLAAKCIIDKMNNHNN